MTELSFFIFSVRRQLNDVPEDYLSAEAIYQALEQADAYLNKVLPSDVETSYRNHCLVALAAYFAYIIYVSSIERGLGGIPAGSEERAAMLRRLALTLIRAVAKFKIADDLTVVTELSERPVIAKLSGSVMDAEDP